MSDQNTNIAPGAVTAKTTADVVKSAAKTEAAKADTAIAKKEVAAVKAEKAPAPVKTAAKAAVKAKPVAKKAVRTKKAASAKKTVAKKTAAKATRKTAAKTAAKKKAPAKKAVAARKTAKKSNTPKKENIMAKTTGKVTAEAKKATEAMTSRVTDMAGDMSERAKTLFAKANEYFAQANEFNKANIEAVVESGKIAAKGAQEMGQSYAADLRTNFEAATTTAKEFAAVKSPTDFVQLQASTARKGFDMMVAQTSKNTEMFLKVAGEAFQPISNRVSVAVEAVKKAA